MTRIILVLGCHRSGTSLVAKSLTCLGAELGPRANWSGPDNPRGFHEHQDILAINQLLVAELGTTWDDPGPWATPDIHSPHTQHIAVAAGRVICTETERYPIFAIKEPRLCRLLPFWRSIFRALGITMSVVHVVRHPLAVAASLKRRNGLPVKTGLRLWLEYTRRARLDVDPAWPAVTVEYDAIMALPVQQLSLIGKALNLTPDFDASTDFARSFVDERLWHEVADDDALLPIEVAAEWALVKGRALG